MYFLRDAHNIVIGRYESEIEAKFSMAELLKDREQNCFSIEHDGKTLYTGKMVGEITKEG